MTEIKTGKGTFLFVEVTEGADRIQIVPATSAGTHKGIMLKWRSGNWTNHYESLPPGQYTFLCVSKNISEEYAGKIVDDNGAGYWDYTPAEFEQQLYERVVWAFEKSTKSFSSLLKSNGLNESLNYAILIKQ